MSVKQSIVEDILVVDGEEICEWYVRMALANQRERDGHTGIRQTQDLAEHIRQDWHRHYDQDAKLRLALAEIERIKRHMRI